jgi:uncharacterized protein YggE
MDRTLHVTGVGSASAPPDLMRVELGAEHEAGSAQQALAEASAALSRMRAELLAAGVDPVDLASSGIDLDTRFGERGTPPGYRASLGLTLLLRDLDSAGALLGRIVAAGGDAARVRRMSLAHQDAETLLAQAREAAWRDAVAKADQYARLAGGRRGAALQVEEVQDAPTRPRFGRAMTLLSAVPVEPGATAVEVSVTATFALQAGSAGSSPSL